MSAISWLPRAISAAEAYNAAIKASEVPPQDSLLLAIMEMSSFNDLRRVHPLLEEMSNEYEDLLRTAGKVLPPRVAELEQLMASALLLALERDNRVLRDLIYAQKINRTLLTGLAFCELFKQAVFPRALFDRFLFNEVYETKIFRAHFNQAFKLLRAFPDNPDKKQIIRSLRLFKESLPELVTKPGPGQRFGSLS